MNRYLQTRLTDTAALAAEILPLYRAALCHPEAPEGSVEIKLYGLPVLFTHYDANWYGYGVTTEPYVSVMWMDSKGNLREEEGISTFLEYILRRYW